MTGPRRDIEEQREALCVAADTIVGASVAGDLGAMRLWKGRFDAAAARSWLWVPHQIVIRMPVPKSQDELRETLIEASEELLRVRDMNAAHRALARFDDAFRDLTWAIGRARKKVVA